MPSKAVLALGLGATSLFAQSPAALAAIPQPKVSTLTLSTPRRDLAGASTGTAAVFGGGCVPGSGSTYVCNDPSDVIDVFKPAATSKASAGDKDGETRWVASKSNALLSLFSSPIVMARQ